VADPSAAPAKQLRRGVYPGSFDPLTIAHVAIAEAARAQHRLDRLDLVISRVPLGKDHAAQSSVEDRLAALERLAEDRPWIGAAVTDLQHLVDIASGYDVLVMGADKWAQVQDPAFYESEAARDAALAGLPALAVAPRPPHPVPDEHRLDVPAHLSEVSATEVREGRDEWRA
jgi:hypothetical protein